MRMKPFLILAAIIVVSMVSLPAFANSYYDPNLTDGSGYCWDGSGYVACDSGISSQLQYGGTTASGGGATSLLTCKAGTSPDTWCFSKSYDCSSGQCVQICAQTAIATGWCQCSNGVLTGSCTML